MAGYRFSDQAPVLMDLLGEAKAANGSIQFYARGTTTPKHTYPVYALTGSPNTNPVLLDSDGRAATEIWLDGDYTAVLYDSDDVEIWTRDIRSPNDETNELPDTTGHEDHFLTVSSGLPAWVELQLLPDPTGSATKMVVVNAEATAYTLQDQPEPEELPDPEYTVDLPNDVLVGTYFRQFGTGTVPSASGAQTSSVAVTFGTAFTSTPVFASVTCTQAGGSTPSGRVPVLAVSSLSTTGMTVTANVSDDDTQSQYKLASATTFMYAVEGELDPP